MEPAPPVTQQPIQSQTLPTEPQVVIAPTPSKIQENNSKVVITSLIVLLLLVGVGAGAYFLGASQSRNSTSLPQPPNGEVGCTMEAKICPDGSSVGRSGPNCEFDTCPETSSTNKTSKSTLTYTLAAAMPQFDEYGDALLNTHADINLTLPEGTQVSGTHILINGSEYQIEVNRMAGPCGMGDDNNGCTYIEESVEGSELLKIWKDNKGVFALNYIGITNNDYYLDSAYISKVDGSIFSNEEIALWKKIFSSIQAMPITANN